MMADLYHAPELKNMYCKKECPIGKGLPVSTNIDSLQGITVRLLNGLDDEEIHAMKKRLISIAADGKIDAEERKGLDAILESLDNLAKTISELRMLAEKFTERGNDYGAY